MQTHEPAINTINTSHLLQYISYLSVSEADRCVCALLLLVGPEQPGAWSWLEGSQVEQILRYPSPKSH
jgi:hypothetical protein